MDEETREGDETLEQTGSEQEPELEKIVKEIETANSDAGAYVSTVFQSRSWWHCEWPGISPDGRMWQSVTGRESFPWDGCSDSRPRTVETLINEHTTISLSAFWSAKVQAKSAPGRQFAHAKESNITQKMLNWAVYTQMKRELISELPLAFQWKWGFGLSFIGVEWEQQRQLVYIPITLDMLSQITQQIGLPDISGQILDSDRTFDSDLVKMLQTLSPVMPTNEARKILTELRNTGSSQIPVANLRVNKPRWTALRPFVDLWFPSETVDIQHARWTARRELVSESELTDRIVTDGYDADFVDEALKHKGVFGGIVPVNGLMPAAPGSDRDLVELFHFRARVLDYGVPCMYKTIFNMAVASDGLYAVHRKDEYEHQQYPYATLCRKGPYRPLLSRIGIASEAYTDEIDIKRQQDGLNDRTDLIHQPPIIVPPSRAGAIANSYGPRSVMTSLRPDVINFPPLPPMDQTPVVVMNFVLMRLNRRYPTQNGEGVDPQMVALYRQELATDTLSELEVALEQTLQLGQQYWTEQDVAMVAGGNFDWKYTQQQIQKQASVIATVDMTLVDPEVAKSKLDMLAALMPFKDQGGMVFNAAANIVDVDLADALTEDQMSPTAMKKEKDDEYNAISQILSGIEPQKPMMAHNELRLQTIQQILSDPGTMQKFQQDQIAQKRLQNRMEFYQNQIQQYQANPIIGRTLTTQTLRPNTPANMTNAQAT